MSGYPRGRTLVAYAARRPTVAARILLARPAWVAFRLVAALPVTVRRIVLAPVVLVAGRVAKGPGDHPIALPARVAGLWLLGRIEAALGVVAAFDDVPPAARTQPAASTGVAGVRGGEPSPRTRRRVAAVLLAMDEPQRADGVIGRHRSVLGAGPEIDALLGRIDLALGRYGQAAVTLDRASRARPRDVGLRASARRARAEAALLDQAWRPTSPVLAPHRVDHRARPGAILHLLTNALPTRQSGYTVRAHQVALCQQAVGLDPTMVTRAGFPGVEGVLDTAPEVRVGPVRYRRLDPDLEPGAPIDVTAERTVAGLLRLAPEVGAAVIQPTSNYVNARAALAVRDRLGIPVVYEVRGFLEETWRSRMGDVVVGTDRYEGARAIETACMQAADAIVTLSETMRREILIRTSRPADSVVVVPNAVDLERFVPGPRDETLASSLGIEPDEWVVGYISSFVRYEGIRFLIEAYARLRARLPRTRLLLVGDGEERTALEEVARDTGAARGDGVIFAGRVPHDVVASYHRLIDVFVVPRTADRVSQLVTPLKPYEAMAMERPIVVSKVGALEEIVADGATGRTAPPEDAERLAEVIAELLEDPEGRRRLGRAGREWVAAHRTWAQNGERYRALYRRLGAA